MLPDFIIIGAMKSGTTSLYHYLNMHPEIGMSRLKETDFFIKEKNYGKGINWYEKLFQGDFIRYGEASPNYTKAHYFSGVPRRIHEHLPDIKLIYLVRDPVDRILSAYKHNYAAGREPYDMEEAFRNEQKFEEYLLGSKYYWQLQKYLEYISEKQIIVVNSNKLRTDRKETLENIFEFLDVDTSFYTDEYENEYGSSSTMSKKGPLTKYITGRSFMWIFRTYIPDNLRYKLKKMILPSVKKKPDITPALRNKFADYLKEDIDALRAYTGETYSEWGL